MPKGSEVEIPISEVCAIETPKLQVEAIKHLGDLVTKMKRAGDGLGVHIIDKELSD